MLSKTNKIEQQIKMYKDEIKSLLEQKAGIELTLHEHHKTISILQSELDDKRQGELIFS